MSVIGPFLLKRTNLSFVTHVDSNKVLLYSFLFLGDILFGWIIFHPTALSLGGVRVRDDVANAITSG